MSEYFFEYTCVSCDSTQNRNEDVKKNEPKFLVYQDYENDGKLCIQVVFDAQKYNDYGVRLYHIENGIDIPKEITKEDFYRTLYIDKSVIQRNGCFFIDRPMLSGTGIFAFVKHENEVPSIENSYTYALNFGAKQEIIYSITPKKKEIVIDIAYPLLRQDIQLQVFAQEGGKPLTKTYRENSPIEPIVLEKGMKNYIHVKRKVEKTDGYGFRLFFKDPVFAKRYLLIDQATAEENTKKDIKVTTVVNGEIVTQIKKSTGRYYDDIGKYQPKKCPYCFNPIMLADDYNKGASYKLFECSSLALGGGVEKGISVDLSSNRKIQADMASTRHLICCGHDNREDNEYQDKEKLYKNLVIPNDYMNKPSMTVAIVGYTGSGKSVMLSTLLGAKSILNERLSQNTSMSEIEKRKNAPNKANADILNEIVKGYSNKNAMSGVQYLDLSQVINEQDREGTDFVMISKDNVNDLRLENQVGANKTQELFGKNYKVEVGQNLPGHTTVKDMKDLSYHPFTFKMGELGYSFFYDIPGELFTTTAEGSNSLRTVRNADCLILIIDGYNKNNLQDSVSQVMMGLKTAEQNMGEEKLINTPIAVVLSKFDRLQNDFDENCHILRENVLDLMKQDRATHKKNKYKNSLISTHIEYSSYEIEQYLSTHGQANFVNNMKKYNYLKYFAASALGSDDCYTKVRDSSIQGERQVLKYQQRPLREELPIIWLMYQMGLIKE